MAITSGLLLLQKKTTNENNEVAREVKTTPSSVLNIFASSDFPGSSSYNLEVPHLIHLPSTYETEQRHQRL